MRAARLCLAGLIVFSFVLLVGGSARAGGSIVDWDKGAYEPGETVRGTTAFGRGCCNRGVPADGPFYVYLYHSTEGTEIPPLPPDAIRVGVIDITGEGPTWNATYEFVAPEVPPGEYDVMHCNDPCTKMLGDLMEPSLFIADDADVRLWARMRWLERRVWGTRDRLQRGIQSRAGELRKEIALLDARVSDLERRLATATVTEPEPDGTNAALVVAAFLGLVGSAAFGSRFVPQLRRSDQRT